jgi:hypothetical protein
MTYYCWIPTNASKLNYNLIARSKKFKDHLSPEAEFRKDNNCLYIDNYNITHLLDDEYISTSTKLDEVLKNCLFLKTNALDQFLTLNLRKDDTFYKGDITISFKDENPFDREKNSFIAVDFKINLNGMIEFNNYQHDNIEDYDEEKDIQVLYVVLKSIIHGDSHHHQKVDTALTITSDKDGFYNHILSGLMQYLKYLEGDIKRVETKQNVHKLLDIQYSINGYISYIKTFVKSFSALKKTGDLELEYFINVSESIKSKIKSKLDKYERVEKDKNNIKLLLPIIISSAILAIALLNGENDIASKIFNDIYFKIAIFMILSFTIYEIYSRSIKFIRNYVINYKNSLYEAFHYNNIGGRINTTQLGNFVIFINSIKPILVLIIWLSIGNLFFHFTYILAIPVFLSIILIFVYIISC